MKNTGDRAPLWNVSTKTLFDANLNQCMTGWRLREIVEATGLSLSGWLTANGFHQAGATRLRQMMTGQRPVSPAIEAKALEFDNPKTSA